ncbi:MAG: hypothetical protein NC231_13760 [Bacillus sp. (in: Bacteria)]|nr:hypothetical protein [Bacillus sp. (in: firmicutes)]MCM1425343.1 hypothetical protein [Eubacterium sp.]
MNNGMYDKINRNKTGKKDTKFGVTVMIILIIAAVIIASFAWSFGFRYRFSHFLQQLSNCTSYALKEDSLTVELNGKLYQLADDNTQGIFNYITLNDYGKESKETPDKEPVTLDYGNGAVIKLWNVPADSYTNSSGLFIYYEDMDGNSYSYINYKMTLETIVTRYLLYNNIEVIEN